MTNVSIHINKIPRKVYLRYSNVKANYSIVLLDYIGFATLHILSNQSIICSVPHLKKKENYCFTSWIIIWIALASSKCTNECPWSNTAYAFMVNLQGAENWKKYFNILLVMTWLFVLHGNQQPWYCLWGINRSLSPTRNNFNHLRHLSVEKW